MYKCQGAMKMPKAKDMEKNNIKTIVQQVIRAVDSGGTSVLRDGPKSEPKQSKK